MHFLWKLCTKQVTMKCPLTMWSLNVIFGHLCVLLIALASSSVTAAPPNKFSCLADRLTVYRVIVQTFWSRENFPKHYPEWRPPAHWSKLVGRSHNESFVLFRLDHKASEGVRIFAETGASDVLDELSQGEGGIYDEFNAPPIPQGVGRAEAEFFVDGNHSRVSLISRVVPSPDWFIGLNSYDLCENGRWIDSVSMEVDPLDAGTDNGLTFTSPNWPTEPRGVVKRLTPRQPNHPASSFFYSDRETLPPIASFQFLKIDATAKFLRERIFLLTIALEYNTQESSCDKCVLMVKEYELSEVFHHPKTEISSNDVIDPETRRQETNLKSATASSSVSTGGKQPNSIIDYLPHLEKKRKEKDISRDKKRKLKKFRSPRDCVLSEWSSWTPCSKTCGLGEMTRTRTVIVHARRGGRPCPPMKEASWCGSARSSCSRSYFNWG